MEECRKKLNAISAGIQREKYDLEILNELSREYAGEIQKIESDMNGKSGKKARKLELKRKFLVESLDSIEKQKKKLEEIRKTEDELKIAEESLEEEDNDLEETLVDPAFEKLINAEKKLEELRQKVVEMKAARKVAEEEAAHRECLYCYVNRDDPVNGKLKHYEHKRPGGRCIYYLHEGCLAAWRKVSIKCMICREDCAEDDLKEIVSAAEVARREAEEAA